MPTPNGVHVIPFAEYAIVLVPLPTATHITPFQTTPPPDVANVLTPNPVQLIPSAE